MPIGGRPLFTESSLSFAVLALVLTAGAELEICAFFLLDVFVVIVAMDDDDDGDDA